MVLESSVKLSHMFPTASIKFGFCFNAAAADAIDGSIFAIVLAYATAIFRKLKYLDSYCTRLSCLRKFHCRCITSVQTLYNLIAWSIQRCVLQITYLIDTITTIFAGNGHLKFYAWITKKPTYIDMTSFHKHYIEIRLHFDMDAKHQLV